MIYNKAKLTCKGNSGGDWEEKDDYGINSKVKINSDNRAKAKVKYHSVRKSDDNCLM